VWGVHLLRSRWPFQHFFTAKPHYDMMGEYLIARTNCQASKGADRAVVATEHYRPEYVHADHPPKLRTILLLCGGKVCIILQ